MTSRRILAAAALALAALTTATTPAAAQRVSSVDPGPAAAPVIAAAPAAAAAPVIAALATNRIGSAVLAASTSPYVVSVNGARLRSWPVSGVITRLMYRGQRISVSCYRIGSDGYRWLHVVSPWRGYVRSDLTLPNPWAGTSGSGGVWRSAPRC